MAAYKYDRREDSFVVQADDNTDGFVQEDFTELEIAEYAVFLFALDTYLRYLAEATGQDDATDPVAQKGLRLARFIESVHLDTIQGYFTQHLQNATLQRMVQRGFRLRPNTDGVGQRALQIRTVLSRGGTATMRAVFKSQKAILAVRAAVNASMVDDADAALDKFAVITMRNARLRDWIDLAAKTAGSGAPPDVVSAATQGVGDKATQVAVQSMTASGQTGSVAAVDAVQARDMLLQKVQAEAKATAQKAMEQAKEADVAPTKSDVVAIATAAAVAATSDPSNNRNVPQSLAFLSDENRAVALMGGRVRVAAGAGAGKSTTLCARVAYLIQDKGVDPSKILVTSFNKKAADELKGKIGKVAGGENAKRMTIGTMHSVCLNFIKWYGEPHQKAMFVGRAYNKKSGKVEQQTRVIKDGQIMKPIFAAWDRCFPRTTKPGEEPIKFPAGQLWKYPPKPKRMRAYMNKFQGAGWTVQQAQDWARASREPEHIQAAVFFEFYEGFKGAFGPNWSPRACPNITKTPEYARVAEHVRGGAARAGDFQDMLTTLRNILRDNPTARQALRDRYDHIFIDECQDLNPVQTEAFLAMAGDIQMDDEKQGIWMVGDDKQSIYMFRGAAPEQFRNLDQKEFKTGYMRTNRRCLPEIVEAANKLVAFNTDQIPMEARPLPEKPRGAASISVVIPDTYAGAAVEFGNKVKQALIDGKEVRQFATLARTNRELHDFETACIIRGVPYVRKGASSFLGAPEAQTFLGFIDLATSNDSDRLASGLAQALTFTKRLKGLPFKVEDVADRILTAIERHAHTTGTSPKDVNPIGAALTDPRFMATLVKTLAGRDLAPFMVDRDSDVLAQFLTEIAEIRTKVTEAQKSRENNMAPGYLTEHLFADILAVTCVERTPNAAGAFEEKEKTFREKLAQQLKFADLEKEDDTSDDEEDGDANDEGLGAVSFFKEMLKPDPFETDLDPTNPVDFRLRIDRYKKRAKDLRIDPNEWEKNNPGVPAPGAYLGTVHSVKGAEWEDVTVLMPAGIFPFSPVPRKQRDDECPEVPLFSGQVELESERRLGYVALTRAINNLTLSCPYEAIRARTAPGTPPPPREAALSRFVHEAGLVLGENVRPQGSISDEPPPAEGPIPVADEENEEPVKTASYDRSVFVACDCGDDPLGPGDADAWRE